MAGGKYDSVYWYLQSATESFTYICHVIEDTIKFEHYQLSVDREFSSSTLTIIHVQPKDKAIYYCALKFKHHGASWYHTGQKL